MCYVYIHVFVHLFCACCVCQSAQQSFVHSVWTDRQRGKKIGLDWTAKYKQIAYTRGEGWAVRAVHTVLFNLRNKSFLLSFYLAIRLVLKIWQSRSIKNREISLIKNIDQIILNLETIYRDFLKINRVTSKTRTSKRIHYFVWPEKK